MLTVNQLVTLIQKNLPSSEKMISLHEPYFSGNEWHYVKDCLDSGWVSSVGKYVDKFEHDLAHYTGASYAVAVVNGTSALHICYLLAGVKAGDEVLVPALTFVGTINPISYCGAIPHFIDAEEGTLGIDPVLLEAYLQDIAELRGNECFNRVTGRPIRALCVMHTLGHPVDLDVLAELCKKYHLALIEDAAEALGSFYKKNHVGHRGVVGALSFNGNKIMTTGGGGAILTDNAELAKRAKHMTTTAKLPHPWAFEHDQVAFNYRLPNINAALGCAQLEKITNFLSAKRRLARQYLQAFANIPGVRFIAEPTHSQSNYWLNALLLDKPLAQLRDPLLTALGQQNIMARPLWNLQHTLPMYQHCPRMLLPVAESLYQRLVKLPSSVGLALNPIAEAVAD